MRYLAMLTIVAAACGGTEISEKGRPTPAALALFAPATASWTIDENGQVVCPGAIALETADLGRGSGSVVQCRWPCATYVPAGRETGCENGDVTLQIAKFLDLHDARFPSYDGNWHFSASGCGPGLCQPAAGPPSN